MPAFPDPNEPGISPREARRRRIMVSDAEAEVQQRQRLDAAGRRPPEGPPAAYQRQMPSTRAATTGPEPAPAVGPVARPPLPERTQAVYGPAPATTPPPEMGPPAPAASSSRQTPPRRGVGGAGRGAGRGGGSSESDALNSISADLARGAPGPNSDTGARIRGRMNELNQGIAVPAQTMAYAKGGLVRHTPGWSFGGKSSGGSNKYAKKRS